MPRRALVIMVALFLASMALFVQPLHSVARAGTWVPPKRLLAYRWAVKQHGKPYCWGGTGPSCYDCSGLVYAAYRHLHIYFGRTTYQMLHSGKLIRISHARARRGDLAFYGTGHVELFDTGHVTYGAHDSGSRIGWIHFNSYWHPTAYYRVRGAQRP
jgi:hypothetical protein